MRYFGDYGVITVLRVCDRRSFVTSLVRLLRSLTQRFQAVGSLDIDYEKQNTIQPRD